MPFSFEFSLDGFLNKNPPRTKPSPSFPQNNTPPPLAPIVSGTGNGEPREQLEGLKSAGSYGISSRPRLAVLKEAIELLENAKDASGGQMSEREIPKEEPDTIQKQLKLKKSDDGTQRRRSSEHERLQNRDSSHETLEISARRNIDPDNLQKTIERRTDKWILVQEYQVAIESREREASQLVQKIENLTRSHQEQSRELANKYQKEKDELSFKVAESKEALSKLQSQRDQLLAKLKHVLDDESDVKKATKHTSVIDNIVSGNSQIASKSGRVPTQTTTNRKAPYTKDPRIRHTKGRMYGDEADPINEDTDAHHRHQILAVSDNSEFKSETLPDGSTIELEMSDSQSESERSKDMESRERTGRQTLIRSARVRAGPYKPTNSSVYQRMTERRNAAANTKEGSHHLHGRKDGIPIQKTREADSLSSPNKAQRSSPIPPPLTPQSIESSIDSNFSGGSNTSFGSYASDVTLIEKSPFEYKLSSSISSQDFSPLMRQNPPEPVSPSPRPKLPSHYGI